MKRFLTGELGTAEHFVVVIATGESGGWEQF